MGRITLSTSDGGTAFQPVVVLYKNENLMIKDVYPYASTGWPAFISYLVTVGKKGEGEREGAGHRPLHCTKTDTQHWSECSFQRQK